MRLSLGMADPRTRYAVADDMSGCQDNPWVFVERGLEVLKLVRRH